MIIKRSGAVFILILILGSVKPGCSQPRIGFFPPQVHQQICQQSTYARHLDVFNTGKTTLSWNAIFTPGPYDWVTAFPLSGEIEPGDTSQIEFLFNSAGLSIDNYYAYLQINSNDPDFPDTTVLAMLHVQDLNIILEPESDSICAGCSNRINQYVFGCSEAYSFSWTSDPPGFISTEKSPEVSPAVNTTYTVTVTDGGYSSQQSIFIHVYGNSDVPENQFISGVTIIPNPVRDRFVMKFNSEVDGNGILRLSDLSGRSILSKRILIQAGLNSIFIIGITTESGIHLVTIELDDPSGSCLIDAWKLLIHQD